MSFLRGGYDRFLEATGVETRYLFQGWTHGRFVSPTVQQAAMTVAAGLADTIAIVHGKKHKAYGQPVETEMWRQGLGPHGETPAFGGFGPVQAPTLAVQRYFNMYGGGADNLAPIAMTLRENARLNPDALRTKPMSLVDYLNSRWIIEPLRLFDCCQNNDGASCLLITTAERARDLKRPSVSSCQAGERNARDGCQHHGGGPVDGRVARHARRRGDQGGAASGRRHALGDADAARDLCWIG